MELPAKQTCEELRVRRKTGVQCKGSSSAGVQVMSSTGVQVMSSAGVQVMFRL